MPELTPETVAVKETPFRGAVPELGTAAKVTPKIRTSTLSEIEPPGPEQDRVKVVMPVKLPEGVPELEMPEEKAEPFLVTEQEVALAEIQLMEVEPPLVILIGPSEPPALMSAVMAPDGGGGLALTLIIAVPAAVPWLCQTFTLAV